MWAMMGKLQQKTEHTVFTEHCKEQNIQHSVYCLPGVLEADMSSAASSGRSATSNVEVQITMDSKARQAI